MKFKRRPDSPLKKKARRGFRCYPVATVAYYGPDDQRASKVAVGIAAEENGDTMMKRLFTEGDARTRVELEHRKLDRYGDRRDEMRTIFDKTGDWGQLLAAFAQIAATLAKKAG